VSESDQELPPALEARIAALERPGATADFDGASWAWMAVLGVALPLALILIGWWV
jgi:hypothetical protein